MIFRLFRRSPQARIVAALYGTIVAQARAPAFYQVYGVPDTVNGRFEMIVLHLLILLHWLQSKGAATSGLGQELFDHFCSEMDGNLREMGVGDLAVPTNMRRIGEAFYGRQAAYEGPLSAGDANALAEALGRTIFGLDDGTNADASRLAAYALEAVRMLATQGECQLGRPELAFPDPNKVLSMVSGGRAGTGPDR
jgi:cytochrome b pre-mRNA-processing protein 3